MTADQRAESARKADGARCVVTAEYNLIKVRTGELKFSFLACPVLKSVPQPALRHAIDLTSRAYIGQVGRSCDGI